MTDQDQQQMQQRGAAETEEELMLRLQSQFGDLDLSTLTTGGGGGNLTSGVAVAASNCSSSEESSLAEPSPEELKAWQEAQFQKGQAKVEAKRDESKSAVQRRRESLKKAKEAGKNNEDDDWEQLPAMAKLHPHGSVFFPSSSTDEQLEVVGIPPLLQELCMSKEGDPDILGTKWQCLYSSNEGDGLSFRRLWSKLQGYSGPTVLLIGAVPSASKSLSSSMTRNTTNSATTIGFYTASPWVESPTMTGSSDCFLFAFDDDADTSIQFFKAIPPPKTAPSKGYMHCNPSSSVLQRKNSNSSNANTTSTGIGIGGSPSRPRLHLTETLEECRALDYCGSFQEGDLLLGKCTHLSNNYFDVEAMEVWAVGGEEWIQANLERQQKEQAIVESQRIQKAKLKDKRQFVEDLNLMSTGAGVQLGGGYFAHQAYVDTNDRCDL